MPPLWVCFVTLIGITLGINYKFEALKKYCNRCIASTLDTNGLQEMVNKAHKKYNQDLIEALHTELDAIKRVVSSLDLKVSCGIPANPLLLSGKPMDFSQKSLEKKCLKLFSGQETLVSAAEPRDSVLGPLHGLLVS